MDLVTAGLSAWQHCTFRNDRLPAAAAGSPKASPTAQQSRTPSFSINPEQSPAAKARGTRVHINFVDGVFRLPEKWGDPTDHFEFAGNLLIAILAHAEGIRIEQLDLEGGALRLHSARRNPTTLCPCLEWVIRGDQRTVDDRTQMERHRNYTLRSVIMPPYAIRISVRDHRALMLALMELISMEAASAEPPEETRSRDPLQLNLVDNRMTLQAEVAIQGAEVQIMGEESGLELPGLKGTVSCPLLDVYVETRQGIAQTVNLFAKELEVSLSAHNHRSGAWEPVRPPCQLRPSYHTQPSVAPARSSCAQTSPPSGPCAWWSAPPSSTWSARSSGTAPATCATATSSRA